MTRPVPFAAVHCPLCSAPDTKVVDSRLAAEGTAVRRRRRCPDCGHRFTTFERIDEAPEVPVTVVKSSGSREMYERAKVVGGLVAATKGRGIGEGEIDRIADAVEEAVRAEGTETTSARIGAIVLNLLGEVDEVSYLRFASVYKNFDAAADFHREIELLGKLGAERA